MPGAPLSVEVVISNLILYISPGVGIMEDPFRYVVLLNAVIVSIYPEREQA